MQATLLTSGFGGNQTSHTTAAISPVEGRVYVCAVACERNERVVTQIVSGAGLSWSSVGLAVARDSSIPRRWMQVFIALADANATQGGLTLSSEGGAIHARGWAVIELQDVTEAFRNLTTVGAQSGVTSLPLTFGEAFDDPANAALAFSLNTSSGSQSQDPNDAEQWTQIVDLIDPPPGAQWSLGVWYHEGETSGMTATWSSSAEAGGLAFELPATGGGTPPTFRPAWAARSTITLQPGRAA